MNDRGMTDERYLRLMSDDRQELTKEELAAGWHFCFEYDGLLCNANDPECKDCGCRCLENIKI